MSKYQYDLMEELRRAADVRDPADDYVRLEPDVLNDTIARIAELEAELEVFRQETREGRLWHSCPKCGGTGRHGHMYECLDCGGKGVRKIASQEAAKAAKEKGDE